MAASAETTDTEIWTNVIARMDANKAWVGFWKKNRPGLVP
jgi:hypothetical protein